MKKFSSVCLCLISVFISGSVHAAPVKEKVLDLVVKLPKVFGSGVSGEVVLEHAENTSRVPNSNQVFETILNFIYAENGREIDHFDPKLGEGIFIPKKNLGGFLDTDLLKARFYPPQYDAANARDVYPVDFKFRASFLKHVFKKTYVTAIRAANERTWKIYYLDRFEVDGMEIQVNALGAVTKMNLTKDGEEVKSLKMSDLPSISESEF